MEVESNYNLRSTGDNSQDFFKLRPQQNIQKQNQSRTRTPSEEGDDQDQYRGRGKQSQDRRGENLVGGGAKDKSGNFHPGNREGKNQYSGGRGQKGGKDDNDNDNEDYDDEEEDYDQGDNRVGNKSRSSDRRGQNLTSGGAYDRSGQFHEGASKGGRARKGTKNRGNDQDEDEGDYDEDQNQDYNKGGKNRNQSRGGEGRGQNLVGGGAMDKRGNFHPGNREGKNQYSSGKGQRGGRDDDDNEDYDEQDYNQGANRSRNQSKGGDSRGQNLVGGGAMDKSGNFHPGNRQGKNQYTSGRDDDDNENYDDEEDYDDNRIQNRGNRGTGTGRQGYSGRPDGRRNNGQNLKDGGAYDRSGQFHEGTSKGGRVRKYDRGDEDEDSYDEDEDQDYNRGERRRNQSRGGDRRGQNLVAGGAKDKSGNFHPGNREGKNQYKSGRGQRGDRDYDDNEDYDDEEDQDYNRGERRRNQSSGGDRRGQNLSGRGAYDRRGQFHEGASKGGRARKGTRNQDYDEDENDYGDDNRDIKGRNQSRGADRRGQNLSGGGAYDRSGQFYEGANKGGRARQGTRNRGNDNQEEDNYNQNDRNMNVRVGRNELKDLLDDAGNFMAQPNPSKAEDNFNDDGTGEFDYVYEPQLSRALNRRGYRGSRGEEVDQAEIDQKKVNYFNRRRGSAKDQRGNAGSGTGTSGGRSRGGGGRDNTGYDEDDYANYEPRVQKRQRVDGRTY